MKVLSRLVVFFVLPGGAADGIYAFVLFEEGSGWLYTPGIGWGYDFAAGEWFSFDD